MSTTITIVFFLNPLSTPSVDFTLHYGIMYKLSGETNRERAVTFSIATMASPVVVLTIVIFDQRWM